MGDGNYSLVKVPYNKLLHAERLLAALPIFRWARRYAYVVSPRINRELSETGIVKDAFCQINTLIDEADYGKAAELIEPLLEADSAYAKYLSAELSLHSIPTHRAMEEVFGEISRDKALLWLKQAADSGKW